MNARRLAFLCAPAFFLVLSAVYFREAITAGALMAAPGDALMYFYPATVHLNRLLSAGDLPLWNPYTFSGTPFMAAHQPAALYPPTVLLNLLLGAKAAFNADFMLHFAMAGYFAHLMARAMTGSRAAGIYAGVAVGFLGFMQANPDHLSIIRTAAWTPLVICLSQKLSEAPTFKRAAALALAGAMQLLAGSMQMAVYSFMLYAAWCAWLAYGLGPDGRKGFFARGLLTALALALGIASPQILATWELGQLSWRATQSYEFFSAMSFSPAKLPVVAFPKLYGDYPLFYMGAGTLMLGIGGALMLWRASGLARFWSAVALAEFVLALGGNTPLYRALYHMPVYNLFRGAERHWLFVYIALVVLAALAIADMAANARRVKKYAIIGAAYAGAYAIIAIAGFAGLLRGIFPALVPEAMRLSSPAAYPWLALAGLYAACLAAWHYTGHRALALALAALLVAEAMYMRHDFGAAGVKAARALTRIHGPAMQHFRKQGVERFSILSEGGGYFVNMAAAAGIEIAEGYDQLQPGQYLALMDIVPVGRHQSNDDFLSHGALMDMLNIRAFLFCSARGIDRARFPASRYPLRLPLDYGLCGIYENTSALPRAYAVRGVAAFEGPEAIKQYLRSEAFDPAATAALLAQDAKAIGRTRFSGGEVRVESHASNRVELSTRFPDTGFVVLADQYYPGWTAEIDGVGTTVYRANMVLRGVAVPAGEHRVVFRYRPAGILAAMALGAALFVAACIVAIRPEQNAHDASRYRKILTSEFYS